MNDGDARALMVRMEAAWPTPRWGQMLIDDWIEDMLQLEAGHAGTAFVKLRQRLTHRPTFADFLTEYKSLSRFDGSKKIDCPFCDSTGWIQSADRIRHGKHCEQKDDCACGSGVVPCECENAVPTRAMHQKYLADEGITVRHHREVER